MKKIKFYLTIYGFVFICAMLGVALAITVDRIHEWHPDYFTVNLFMGIFLAIAAVWLSILLHELVHALVYKINGIGIRLFYIVPFCFIKEDQHIRFFTVCNIWFAGIVVPEIFVANNPEELEKIKKSMVKSLFAAPFVSAIVGICSLLLALFGSEYVSQDYRSYFFIFLSVCFLAGVYINFTSLLKAGGVIGDYAGAKMLCRS